MLCYKDTTFCKLHLRCKAGEACGRALTELVRKDAKDFGLPVAYFTNQPDCYDLKNKGAPDVQKTT